MRRALPVLVSSSVKYGGHSFGAAVSMQAPVSEMSETMQPCGASPWTCTQAVWCMGLRGFFRCSGRMGKPPVTMSGAQQGVREIALTTLWEHSAVRLPIAEDEQALPMDA